MTTAPDGPAGTDLGSEVFRTVFDTAPDGMIVVADDGRIVMTNAQALRMFGYSVEELVGEHIEILVPVGEREGHVGLREGFMRDAGQRSMGSGITLFAQHKDGAQIPVEIMLSPLTSSGRRLVCAAVRDVSERERAARQVKLADELLRSAVESFHGSFAVFDKGDELVMCNSSCRATFGRAVEGALVGKRYEEIVLANVERGVFGDEADATKVVSKWLAYHAEPKGTLEVRTRDGQEFRIVERPTSAGGTVSTAVDISDDAAREAELRDARAIAEKASRAKSEFLASMSHELRTPLNAVLGFAQLLQRDRKSPLNERQLERLGHVSKGGEHLLRLIDDVLDLARIEAGRITVSVEPVTIRDVLDEVLTTLSPIADRADISLAVSSDSATDAVVMADRTRLKQILLNYGSNAVKYGRAGGYVKFRVETRAEVVRVRVTDDGIGIADRYHDKVFSPFARAGQEAGPIEGTGIGLAICERLATLMGGAVGFESSEGEGSSFWVEMARPKTTKVRPEQRTPQSTSTLDALDRSVIVYIEDNPSNIAFMEAFLSDYAQIELMTAPNAELGIEMVEALSPDVVLMDLNLPGMSGFEATRRLRESPETAHIPVVAISAAAMSRDRERARDAGFHTYLTKPVEVDALTATLEEILRK